MRCFANGAYNASPLFKRRLYGTHSETIFIKIIREYEYGSYGCNTHTAKTVHGWKF